MNIFKNLGETISNTAKNVIFQCKEHSPEILLGTSIVLAGAAVVTACFQTMKLDKIVDEHKETLDKIEELKNDDTAKWVDRKGEKHPYDEKTAKNDKICAYRHYAWRLVKNYWLPITLFSLSTAAGIGSFVIMKNRLAASVTFANGLLATLTAYRAKVADKIGEEAERDLYFDRSKFELSSVGPDGVVEKATINTDSVMDKPFCFKFNQSTSPELWDKDPEITLAILRSVEEWVEHKCFGLSNGATMTLPEALSRLKLRYSSDEKSFYKELSAGWQPEMREMLEYEGMNGIKHVDFGLEKYADRNNWPEDGDWVLEINCQCLRAGYNRM